MASPLTADDAQPDATVLWRWVWRSVRPVLGYLLVVTGLLLVLFAYLGVSREVLVAKQLPYLVSGGLSGLAAVTLGSRLMLLEDLRRDTARMDRLEQVVVELHRALLTHPEAPSPTYRQAAASGNGNASTETLLALAGGDRFHRQDCPMVRGKDTAEVLTPNAAKRKGLQACLMCQPLVTGV